ncbi:FadR family transcriptional regulator [Streptomyces sp. ND05-13A]|nr:FadR family transcriptional regulator [Streptomyces caniscabiei]
MSGERTMRRMSQESVGRRRFERRVSSQSQHEVIQLVLDRRLQAGAPPTETELMEDLGVSRDSVREAPKALQALDTVDIRHGYGTYAGEASLTPFVDGLTFRTLARPDGDTAALAEILQVREILEDGLVRRVAGTLTDDEPDALEAVVDRLEAAGKAGEPDDPTPELTVRRHRDIVAALRARDDEGAQRAMSDHFRGIEARAAQASRGVG